MISQGTGNKYLNPAKLVVMFSSHPMRNDARYVDKPDEFQEGRFLRECRHARRGTEKSRLDNSVADVFSFGPRMCLGARLAEIELLSILAATLERYRVELSSLNETKVYGVKNTFMNQPDPTPKFEFHQI